MLKLRTVVYSLIGMMVAGVGFGLIGYHRLKGEPKNLLSVLPKNNDVSLNHIHHVATRDGVKEWTLDAESAQYQKADNKTVFKDILATFFLKHGKSIHLNGRDGVFLTDTKNMEVWGDVVVQSGEYKLNTDKLRYEHKTQTISTETPIVIKGDRIEITGDRMVFNLETEQMVVCGRVEAVLEGWSL
ncbi:MAG TPA: LPS export ABC transporter periplasmic protein LptC [Desulfobacterales bacterium]|nr:LPS export ABC transporter periplasmic protein LptC [Desulfobacterales bacterium]